MTTIGLDFDGVIFDMQPVIIEQAMRMFGRETPDGAIPAYSLEEVYGLNWTEVRQLILECQQDRHLLPELVMPGAVESLNMMGKSGPIIIITARPNTNPVKEWLRSLLDVDLRRISVIHSHSVDKGACAHSLGLDAFVDDHHVSLTSMMEHGVRPLLFDQPWNRSMPVGRRRLSAFQRVMGWPHLMEIVGNGNPARRP